MITNLLLGIIFVFVSLSVFGQEKPQKAMAAKDSVSEVIIHDSKGLKVSQSGKQNSVKVSQSEGRTHVSSQGKTTTIISKNGNTVVHKNGDSTGTNAVNVSQSGSGNRVVIRQSGSGNSVSVSQSPEKKKED